MKSNGVLICFCGKMGAGKSTKSKVIADERNAVLISEDDWLTQLYPEQIKTFDDYIYYSSLLRPIIKKHVIAILRTGADVVMDFPANTKKQRQWFKGLSEEAQSSVELIYVKANDRLCLQQLAQRKIEQPARADFDTEAVFSHVTKFFEEPDTSEFQHLEIIERSVD